MALNKRMLSISVSQFAVLQFPVASLANNSQPAIVCRAKLQQLAASTSFTPVYVLYSEINYFAFQAT
jgi:hypothetical protein